MTARTAVTPSGSVIGVQIKRGRNRLQQQFSPGTISILYDNTANDFPPFSPSVKAGSDIEIDFDDGVATPVRIFTGAVWQVSNSYPLGGRPTTLITGRDTLDVLNRGSLPGEDGASRPQETTGARIGAIITALTSTGGLSLTTNLDTGSETIRAQYTPYDVYQLQNILSAEVMGKLYADRSGVIQFRQRNAAGAPSLAATFSDDGVYLPFHDIGVSNGSDTIINSATENQQYIGDFDATSMGLYGTNSFVITGSSLFAGATLAEREARQREMCEWLVNTFKTPSPRISSIAVDLHLLSNANAATVAALDINDQIRIIWTPPGTSQVDKTGVIESIEHTISIDTHRMVIGLTEPTGGNFTLDDAVYGVLDQNTLGI